MTPDRFASLARRYGFLRIAVVGDFCLDRYLEIDPARTELSIETGLPVYNVVRVRAQAGAAGTIVNNLVALGIGTIDIIGFYGEDGEGYELRRTLEKLPGIRLDLFLETAERRTFTYCKPILVQPGQEPRELNRLDSKNWSPTPESLGRQLAAGLMELASRLDAIVVMEQVDQPETGAVVPPVREALGEIGQTHPSIPILADSRRGLSHFPPLGYKMNLVELGAMLAKPGALTPEEARQGVVELACRQNKPVFVTMAEHGILGAGPDGALEHVPSHPLRGPIDVVGAGDSVTANLAAALAAGADLREAMEIAMAAASLVVHQLGTTGVATVAEIESLLAAQG